MYLIDFIYPPLCRHCNAFVETGRINLCELCFQEVELIDPQEHCHRCLALKDPLHRCSTSELDGCFACLSDSLGARKLLFSGSTALSAFALHQWALLPWPLPDLITATPGNRSVDKLFNIRTKIAKNLSLLWDRPFLEPPHILQECLTNPFIPLEHQKQSQDPKSLQIRHGEHYVNKKVLLIHDIISTNIALTDTARAFKRMGALEVYGLSLVFE